MKKILTGVIGCVFLFVIFSFLFPMSTVKSTVNLYWILNHRPFVTYVDGQPWDDTVHVIQQQKEKDADAS